MNKGEKDEIIVQLKLIELRDNKMKVQGIGTISSVGLKREYLGIPVGIDLSRLNSYSESELIKLALSCGVSKAGTSYKADTQINGFNYSLKSKKSAPPAIVNHTTRPGFEFAANISGGSIDDLDKIIDEYWLLRFAGTIAEDISNSNTNSPFRLKKNILKPFINYFLFKGSGSNLSLFPAQYILDFLDPLNTLTWKIWDETNAVDLYWEKLIFSIRAKKGMPKGYPNSMSNKFRDSKSSIVKWTKFIANDYRGALHIRVK